jgi:adenosine deaminase
MSDGNQSNAAPGGGGFAEYFTRLPKVDLHCHLVGTLRPSTLGELARKHGIALPRDEDHLYDFEDFYSFIEILRLSATVMRTQEDFARVAYEALADGRRAGNLKHVELMFNPQYFYASGVRYRAMVDGLIEGIEAARQDHGTTALLIPSIDRQIDPAHALEILQDVLDYRPDPVAGIGLDGPERAGPPARFHELYRRAGEAGLRRTAHVCEDNQTLAEAPPQNFAACCDILGCDRLDHGYNILADDGMVRRARDQGLYFNTCSITSVRRNLGRRQASIARMIDLGLRVTLNTDDPQMFRTDIGHTYRVLFEARGWGREPAIELALNGIEASWLGGPERASLRRQFEEEIKSLDREFDAVARLQHH